jgi:PGF-CTERM protein
MPTGGPRGTPNGRFRRSLLALVAVTAVVASVAPVGVATAGADATLEDPDSIIVDGENYFVGQVLYTGAFDPGDEVTLSYTNGTFVTEVPVDPDGDIVIQSGRYGPGEYVLEDLDGDSVRFGLNDQLYEISTETPVVENGGTETDAAVVVRSNRNSYRHAVSSDRLSATRLRDVFGVGVVEDVNGDGSDELLLPDGTTRARFSLDFEGVRPGNHTFEFSVLDTDDTATAEFDVELYPSGDATFDAGEGPVRLQQAPDRSFRGTSSLPDGTRLGVVVRNEGGQGFRRSSSVFVANGRFEATFDFSGVPVGQEFVVDVTQGPVVRDRIRGVVVRAASIAAEDVSGGDVTVTLQEVTLPRGGFAAVVVGGNRVLGTTDRLDPGTHTDVTVSLDEPIDPARNSVAIEVYEDTDGDGTFDRGVDDPYTLPDGPVSTVVAVGEATGTPTETPTTTATATPTSTPTATATATATPTGTPAGTPTATADDTTATTGGGGPGFGVVVALLAVVAVLLFRRSA